jgi:uncharacterized membrane protein|uniref:Uncharacterized protein n=1 Tax=viral metagenome TaxID=1070528 RepID=A0A6C0EED1_9ZZZZ
MTCIKKLYQNDYDKTSNKVIIDNENYGSNLNNTLKDVTNLNDIDQLNNFNDNNNYYIDIKLPHEKSINENINNIYNLFIKIFNIIMMGNNPIPVIFSSADAIFGTIFIILIILIIIILLQKIFIS